MTTALRVAGLGLALTTLAPAPLRAAGVLDWLNRKVASVLSDEERESPPRPDLDRYLKLLSAPRRQGEAASPDRRPRAPAGISLSEALREIIPEGEQGSRETRLFNEGAYTVALAGARLGYRLPHRALGELEGAMVATERLLAVLETTLRTGMEARPVGRIHGEVEGGLLAVQATHHLLVETRALAEEALGACLRTGQALAAIVSEEGHLHALPIAVGMTQTYQKASDSLGAAVGAMASCTSFLRQAFHSIKGGLAALDDAIASSPHLPPDVLNLDGRPQAREALVRAASSARQALAGGAGVVRMARSLVRLNLSGLLQVLAALDTPSKAAAGPAPATYERINGRLARAATTATAHVTRSESRQAELARLAGEIRAHRTGTVEIEDLPGWLLGQTTLPRRDSWADYSLLPEGESQVDAVIRTLEDDLSGRAPSTLASRRLSQIRLDRALGDDDGQKDVPRAPRPPARDGTPVSPAAAPVPGPRTPTSSPDHGAVPAARRPDSGPGETVAGARAADGEAYRLPSWY